MKFAFCTCVQIGLSCMEAIYRIGGKLDLIITLKDEKAKKKSGRIFVDEFAGKHDVPVLKINHVNDPEVINALWKHNIDWLFIIGWSQIASIEVIHAPAKGTIGAHPTLLPQGRGRAAISWAIIKDLPKTGVTFFKMNEGVDTGPILDQYEIHLDINETATTLYDKVNAAHIELIGQIWEDLKEDRVKLRVQDESYATYWEGRTPEDGRLSYSMTVEEAHKLIRATTHPYPGAFITHEDVDKIIWLGKIGKHDGAFELEFKDGYYTVIEYEIKDR